MQLQRLALHFSATASMHWDLAAFSAANREARTSADPAVVSSSPPATSDGPVQKRSPFTEATRAA